jgi:protein-arginine kinase activator protein McsA
MHPKIEKLSVPLESKLQLQRSLENTYNNDFDKLLEDVMKYASSVKVEDYETAALVRDIKEEPLSN